MPDAPSGTPPLPAYFSVAAYLEAASSLALERLGCELAAHRAPRRLVDACHRAALSKTRQATAFSRLAAQHDILAPTPRARPLPVRSLVEVAIENIVEGFVRQTYGAAVARFRSRRAADPRIRSVMLEIADHDIAHADLAFEVAIWLQRAIDPVEGAWVENAMRHAVIALVDDLDVEPDSELCARAGVPTRSDAFTIWSRLSHRMWHGSSERIWRAGEGPLAAEEPSVRSVLPKARVPFDSIAA